MPAAYLTSPDGVPEPIRDGLGRLRERLGIEAAFPAAVLAEADAASRGVRLPERDLTDVEFVTIDPPGSTDLDQAVHVARAGDGYLVRYAIADVGAFVRPGGALDAEAHARGVTLYAPHERVPLHPPVLSEGAASLLPGQVRPALVWEHILDSSGEVVGSTVVRARVRSRRQLTYAGVQAALDAGQASEVLRLVREVGLAREALEVARAGVSLQIPEQEVHVEDGQWRLDFRSTMPVEGWNAQISLLTGMAAADLMLAAGVGVVRTLPPARQAGVERLRRVAKGLGIRWPGTVDYPEFVRSLDPAAPRHLAMLYACTTLFRGAGYAAFDGVLPEQRLHGAMNAPYAHATAPLRRLVDRYVGEMCVSISGGNSIPGWVEEALEGLPATMARATQRANAWERGVVNLVEALVLEARVGERFAGVVTEWDAPEHRGEIQVSEPAVAAPLAGVEAELGAEVMALLDAVDLAEGRVHFTL